MTQTTPVVQPARHNFNAMARPSPLCHSAELLPRACVASTDQTTTFISRTLRLRLSCIHIAILGVVALASLSSATIVKEDAYNAHITKAPTLITAPSDLPTNELEHLLIDRTWPLPTEGRDAPRLEVRSPQGGGGGLDDEAPPKEKEKEKEKEKDDGDNGDNDKSSEEPTKTKSSSKSKSVSSTKTDSTEKPKSTEDATSSPLPSAFDNTPASAFKIEGGDDTCPRFMTELLSSDTFKKCYPLSLMLQTSTSFFQAEKKLLSIVKVLDATCKADVAPCADFFETAARDLMLEKNCKSEVDNKLSLVLQAYRGLMAYRMMYSATCLQDPDTDMYCFASAVTNIEQPSDVYLYFMPYGIALPGSSVTSCSWCTKQTMAIFHAASADRKRFIADTYKSAAHQINTLCDPDFVNITLPRAVSSARNLTPVSVFMMAVAFASVVATSSLL